MYLIGVVVLLSCRSMFHKLLRELNLGLVTGLTQRKSLSTKTKLNIVAPNASSKTTSKPAKVATFASSVKKTKKINVLLPCSSPSSIFRLSIRM